MATVAVYFRPVVLSSQDSNIPAIVQLILLLQWSVFAMNSLYNDTLVIKTLSQNLTYFQITRISVGYIDIIY